MRILNFLPSASYKQAGGIFFRVICKVGIDLFVVTFSNMTRLIP